mmetsp:Transcript_1745/g.2954  ORF Transcript_1745/g.2954 Transcript_1745/m.2954 type:complete len:234 (-) Transcript_1745:81-782(-)
MFESWHILNFPKQPGNTRFVTKNSTDFSVIDGIDHSVRSKSRVDSRNTHALRPCAKCTNHPFGAGILVDCQSTAGSELVKSCFVRRGHQPGSTKTCTKLLRCIAELLISAEAHTSKLLLFFVVFTKVFTNSHSGATTKAFEGVKCEFMESGDAFNRCDLLSLVLRIDTMSLIAVNWNGAHGRAGEELLDSTQPSKRNDSNEKVNSDQNDLEGEQSDAHDDQPPLEMLWRVSVV